MDAGVEHMDAETHMAADIGPAPRRRPAPPVPMVGIGASSGGLAAFEPTLDAVGEVLA
jgi:chemotaxis response regulator CheB